MAGNTQGVGESEALHLDLTSMLRELLGIPLAKMVATTGPGVSCQFAADVNVVAEKPAFGSRGRKTVSSLSTRRSCSNG